MGVLELRDEFNNFFTENWLENLAQSNNQDSDIIISSVKLYCEEIFIKSYNHLIESLIFGEYLFQPRIIELLEGIEGQLDRVLSTFDLDTNELYLQLQDEISNSYIKLFKTALKLYQSLIGRVSRKFRIDQSSELLFVVNRNEKLLFQSSTLDHYYYLFKVNINVALIDHSLSLNKNNLRQLLIYDRNIVDLLKNIEEDHKHFLKDKISFLIKKLLERLEKDEKNYLYIFEYEDKPITKDEISIEYFKEFELKSLKHYNSNGKYDNEIKILLSKLSRKEHMSYSEYHEVIKYAKDIVFNPSLIKEIYNSLCLKIDSDLNDENLREPDKYAYDVIQNYALNNYFSLELENNIIDLKEINKWIERIQLLQDKTQILNYFPYYKVSIFLNNRLREELLKDSSKINISFIEELIKNLEKNLKIAYKNFEWCKDRNFLAFQLPLDECITSNKLFLYSSFVLPINYEEEARRKLDEINSDLISAKNLISTLAKIKEERAQIDYVKNSLKKYEKSSIEILAIFSAIVLFATGSLQIFNIKGISFYDGLFFVLCFSFSLTLFASLILFLTKDREDLKQMSVAHKTFYGIQLLLLLVILFFVIEKRYFKEENKVDSKNSTKFESIK